jgi:16S rRNA processing protein RimM
MRKASTLASSSSTSRVFAGRIGRPHGLEGDVTVVPEDSRWFYAGRVLWSGDTRFVVAASQPYRDKGLTVRFEGVADRIAAEALRGTDLSVDLSEVELEDGEYWPADLIGLTAVDPAGEPLGEVVDVAYGPQDRLVVEMPGGRRVEVPFMDGLVGDPADGRIVIDPPGGLFDET